MTKARNFSGLFAVQSNLPMSTASTLAIGKRGVANRNNNKTNSGPSTISDGNVYIPVGTQFNYDPDQIDTAEWGRDNVVTVPSL